METCLSILSLSLALAATGCATDNLPRGSSIVGGGLSVEWRTPSAGTAILRETTSGRIVATESLEEGDDFQFPSTPAHQEALFRNFGDPMPANLSFVLYFVPAPNADE